MDSIYVNPAAKTWEARASTDLNLLVQSFHEKLPGFGVSPLVPMAELARDLGVKAVFVKDESSRLGLPAFKILGASWGAFRAIADLADNLSLDSSLEEVSRAVRRLGLSLYAATDGNHGRAVARMARILGVAASIYVPAFTDVHVQRNIEAEGAKVTVVPGNYDDAVAVANAESRKVSGGLHVQDNAFDDYEKVPGYIIEGYSTLLREVEQQLEQQGLKATAMVTPIGVGSLGHAVTAYCKSSGRQIDVVAVEPETAACLHDNLRSGEFRSIETSKTIMDGMNCGTVSHISWPILRQGVDVSVTICDRECHEAVEQLQKLGVHAGPCGAASLAATKKVAVELKDEHGIRLNGDSVVVLLSTEGSRFYVVPE
ncbi:uncharacterized protein HMPREF1541_09192 [Cyphellophora europaea CBS 101466]|uniref:Tryptophan synthase beta chain-like PALP domain-containing protein n=1 Tax=Cyphellophora europaea (strain CBS 101466) TaxID=1220924 RepID=W2S9H4_CYPE1|nr:uncharacterized protein HMPREF1541_09192 [Cyphellophora europaea CBS 101466]ETN45361.1 hypothetical protein HMPREF1541_09192 [Cyphellophora europaea CBS 101466]